MGGSNSGPEHELRAALLGRRCSKTTDIPLEMLLSPAEYREWATPLEERAVTPVAVGVRSLRVISKASPGASSQGLYLASWVSQ